MIRGDSLRGFSDEARANPTALAVRDIQSARTRQFSGGRTAALALGLVAVAAGALLVFAAIAFSNVDY
jgi:hypothetical protein